MEQTLYMNKCRTCGTEVVTTKKIDTCMACGSDSMHCSKHGVKEIDIKAICVRVILFALAASAVVALIMMF